MSINHIVKKLNESRNTMTPEIMDVASEIQQALQKELTSYMTSEGFPPEEVKDYSRVDTIFRDGMLVIEVGAEVSYEGLMDLCDKLNPIVAHYDKDAYFEPITSGIIGAWLSPDEIIKDDVDESQEYKEFPTEDEAYEYAKEFGYTINKIQSGHGEKACMCWMTKDDSLDESEDFDKEKEVWDVIDPAIRDAVKSITGDGFDDTSYDYFEDEKSFRCQGVVFFDSEKDSTRKWKALNATLRKALEDIGYTDYNMYDTEKEFTPPNAPFVAYRIYIRAQKDDTLGESMFNRKDEWIYWEMPEGHKGPWQHPHYYKDYGQDVLGFIYPPFETDNEHLKSEAHHDYVAELYDNRAAREFDMKGDFNSMEDAKKWVDEQAAYTLEHR